MHLQFFSSKMILFIKILKLLSWVPVQNISYRIEIQTIYKPKATNTDNVIPSISWRPWPPKKRLVMKSLIVIRVMDEALYSSVRSPPYGSRQSPREEEEREEEERRVRWWGILGPGIGSPRDKSTLRVFSEIEEDDMSLWTTVVTLLMHWTRQGEGHPSMTRDILRW